MLGNKKKTKFKVTNCYVLKIRVGLHLNKLHFPLHYLYMFHVSVCIIFAQQICFMSLYEYRHFRDGNIFAVVVIRERVISLKSHL